MSYLHLGDGSLRRVVEVAQGIQLPTQLAEEMLELVLEFFLRVILSYSHGLFQELQTYSQPAQRATGGDGTDMPHTKRRFSVEGS